MENTKVGMCVSCVQIKVSFGGFDARRGGMLHGYTYKRFSIWILGGTLFHIIKKISDRLLCIQKNFERILWGIKKFHREFTHSKKFLINFYVFKKIYDRLLRIKKNLF